MLFAQRFAAVRFVYSLSIYVVYLLCKLMYIANALGQIYLINVFLGERRKDTSVVKVTLAMMSKNHDLSVLLAHVKSCILPTDQSVSEEGNSPTLTCIV